jgi:hypothetical protein
MEIRLLFITAGVAKCLIYKRLGILVGVLPKPISKHKKQIILFK